jgi:hypothetical protein
VKPRIVPRYPNIIQSEEESLSNADRALGFTLPQVLPNTNYEHKHNYEEKAPLQKGIKKKNA